MTHEFQTEDEMSGTYKETCLKRNLVLTYTCL